MSICADHKDMVAVLDLTSNKANCELCQKLQKLERLQGIVDKLPKCWRLKDGKLVQDVLVLPEMTIWYDSPLGVVSEVLDDWGDVVSVVYDYTFEIYSTREAAEAAKEE